MDKKLAFDGNSNIVFIVTFSSIVAILYLAIYFTLEWKKLKNAEPKVELRNILVPVYFTNYIAYIVPTNQIKMNGVGTGTILNNVDMIEVK